MLPAASQDGLEIPCDALASQMMLVVKNLPANSEDKTEVGLIPGSRRSPGVGNGNPLQYSFLENPMDRGTWQSTVQDITKSWTCLSTRAFLGWLTPFQTIRIFLVMLETFLRLLNFHLSPPWPL